VLIRQYLLPTKMTRSYNAAKPSKGKLTLSAMVDTGPEQASMTGWVTVQIGAFERTLGGGFVADGKGRLHATDATLDVTLVPGAGGGSRCPLTVKLKGADVALVPADGPIALRLACGNVDAQGSCTVAKGRYARGGDLPGGTMMLSSAKATLKGGGKDSFSASFVISPDAAPGPMPDVVFEFGPNYARSVPGASFKPKGLAFRFTDRTNALPSMTVDFKKGLVTVTGRNVDLGTFDEGVSAVRFVLGPTDGPAAIDVRMVRKGRTLKY
jgi:hypothetical protein